MPKNKDKTHIDLKELLDDARKDRQLKQNEESVRWTKWMAVSTMILALFTILLAIASTDTAISTRKLVDTQNILLEREATLEGPYLTAWQTEEVKAERGNFISKTGWEDLPHITMCFRNDGKTSTGPINIKSLVKDWANWTVERKYIDNLPSHDGKCIALGVRYCIKDLSSDCSAEIVPTGNVTIPIYFDCTFCDIKPVINARICSSNWPTNECGKQGL